MGNLSTCEPVQQRPLINIEQSLDVSGTDIERKIEYSHKRNRISEAKMRAEDSLIEQSIEKELLLDDDLDFNSELFYCWVTSDFKDRNPDEQTDEWKFKFKLHIADKYKQGYCTFTTTYSRIQQVYSAAYGCKTTRKYFPKSRFSEKFRQDHKNNKQLKLMEKYMVLYEVLWADQSKPATQNDVQTCCDVLIKLLNSPLFIQKKNNIFFALEMKDALKIQNLLQRIAKKYITSLSKKAKRKGYCGNDSKSPLWKVTKWSHLTFHTVSLVERPNNNVSNHWGLKFESDRYILSLDWFIKDAVYYQIVQNDAIGHKIAWYWWITQTKEKQFVHHWSERIRVSTRNWSSHIVDDSKNEQKLQRVPPMVKVGIKFKMGNICYVVVSMDNHIKCKQYGDINEEFPEIIYLNHSQLKHVSIIDKKKQFYDITFYDICRLVNMWKLIINNKYHVFDNNCQHFARDLLSVFAVNAAKKLTDSTQNIFISANMTLKTELDRVDQISKRLKQQLKEDYDAIKNDKVFLWLKRVGLPQYYHIFKAQDITVDMLRGGIDSEARNMMGNIIIDEEHREQILQQIPECPNWNQAQLQKWNKVKSLLNGLNLLNKSHVIGTFKKHGIIDMDALCELNEQELKQEMKIVLGNRKKILKAIKKNKNVV